jgi:predicted YcjX-like family ATPase
MASYTSLLNPVRLLGDAWDEFGVLSDRALNRHVRLAVTGLSRSGKTVFITSVVHHLLDGHGLPFLEAVHDERYLGAQLVDEKNRDHFPYRRFHADLSAQPPRWPRATDRLTTLELEIAYRTKSLVLRQVQPIQHLTIEIIDYPGEWLLDLPLLEQSYEQFSLDAIALAEGPARRVAAEAWLAALRGFDAQGPEDEAAIAALADLYRRYLVHCQRELGLSRVQPGRFTNPGGLEGSALLRFCPLPPGEVRVGTNGARMAERFERYREEVVRRFYEEHFSRFDRQIVLVDLLSSLNAGPEHFADTQETLALILKSFRYGSTGLLGRLFAPRIDRLLFAVSKADHVAPNQHPALKQLLELMIQPAARAARYQGITIEVATLASLRCTDVVRTEHHGQVLSCVRGHLKDENRETVLFPGEIPPDLPEPEDWASGRFHFREFAPRRLVPSAAGQHIRLDQALQFLIGDKFA